MVCRPRKLRSRLVFSLAAFAGFALGALPAVAQPPLTVTAVDPDGAVPGDAVAAFGTGFGQAAEDLFVWAGTGDGGFPFEVTRAQGQRLDAVLGDVPVPATGSLKVWKGKRYPLADQVILTQGHLFSASETQVFATQESASGPAFSAFDASPGTLGSILAQERVRIDLTPFETGKPELRVRVTAVIETGGEPGTPDPPAGAQGTSRRWEAVRANSVKAGPAWAATLTIGADSVPSTPASLAAALADVLNQQLGSVGLTAQAEGPVLVVGHSLGIAAGFLNLSH